MPAQKFDLKTPDGNCDCYTSWPDSKEPVPGVLLLMDAYGPREYLYEMTDRMASLGYFVLLPNLFYRIRRAPVIDAKFPITLETGPAARAELMKLFTVYNPDEGVKDIGIFLDYLAHNEHVKGNKFGVTGYCMGGGLAIRAAAEYPNQVAAAASFHGGRLATDAPNSPHKSANKIKARLYIAHAENDESIPEEQIKKLEETLTAAGVTYESEIYKGAKHGFTMKDLPPFNEAALEQHWQKLTELFHSELKNVR